MGWVAGRRVEVGVERVPILRLCTGEEKPKAEHRHEFSEESSIARCMPSPPPRPRAGPPPMYFSNTVPKSACAQISSGRRHPILDGRTFLFPSFRGRLFGPVTSSQTISVGGTLNMKISKLNVLDIPTRHIWKRIGFPTVLNHIRARFQIFFRNQGFVVNFSVR